MEDKKNNDLKKLAGNDLVKKLKEAAVEEMLESMGDVSEEARILAQEKLEARLEEDLSGVLEGRISDAKKQVLKDVSKTLKKEKSLREKAEKEDEYFIRLNRNFRFQHMCLALSVIGLIISGLPLKFTEATVSGWLISLMGGIDGTRIFHRVAASLLIYFFIHHLFYTIFSKAGRRDWLMLVPKFKDLKDVIQIMKYFLGRSEVRPKFDRFNYVEKFDYWAVYWGCAVMIGTGLLMWFENISLHYVPKYFVDAANEAHSDEAVLATLVIIIWHFYNVHFNPDRFPGSLMWWNGKISKEDIMHEHPLEYERLMAERRNQMLNGDKDNSSSKAEKEGA